MKGNAFIAISAIYKGVAVEMLNVDISVLESEWVCFWDRIAIPTHMKSKALNIAWVTRWKKHKEVNPKLRVVAIKPNWLRVERATTCFMSRFRRAQYLADIMVISPVVRRRLLKVGNRARK